MKLPLYIATEYGYLGKDIAIADATCKVVVWVSKDEPKMAQKIIDLFNGEKLETKVA